MSLQSKSTKRQKQKKQQQNQKHNQNSKSLSEDSKNSKWNIERIKELKTKYPDNIWKHWPPIDLINQKNPLRLLSITLKHSGNDIITTTTMTFFSFCFDIVNSLSFHSPLIAPIFGIEISPDGSLLAVSTLLGMIYIWNVSDWKLLRVLRDINEV
jgi:WD40 repeat protein